jgi:hypothetical protein
MPCCCSSSMRLCQSAGCVGVGRRKPAETFMLTTPPRWPSSIPIARWTVSAEPSASESTVRRGAAISPCLQSFDRRKSLTLLAPALCRALAGLSLAQSDPGESSAAGGRCWVPHDAVPHGGDDPAQVRPGRPVSAKRRFGGLRALRQVAEKQTLKLSCRNMDHAPRYSSLIFRSAVCRG